MSAPLDSRCGRADCHQDFELQAYCRPCRRRLVVVSGGSWLSIAAAIAGFVGVACAPLGLVAVVMAVVDLSMIASGRAPKGGAKLDAVAIVLGGAGTALGGYLFQRSMGV